MENQNPPTTSPPEQPAPETTNTEIPTSPQKPKISLLIGMIVLVLVLLASTGYLAFQNFQLRKEISQLQSSPSPTSTPDPTANWKTYESEKGGFVFKYPSDLVANSQRIENEETVTLYASIGDARLGLECEERRTGTSYDPCEANKVVSVSLADFDKDGYAQPDILKPKIFIDREGNSWTISDIWTSEVGSNFLASVETDSRAYTVTMQAGLNGMEKYLKKGLDDATLFSEHERIAKQILSTFQFAD